MSSSETEKREGSTTLSHYDSTCNILSNIIISLSIRYFFNAKVIRNELGPEGDITRINQIDSYSVEKHWTLNIARISYYTYQWVNSNFDRVLGGTYM